MYRPIPFIIGATVGAISMASAALFVDDLDGKKKKVKDAFKSIKKDFGDDKDSLKEKPEAPTES